MLCFKFNRYCTINEEFDFLWNKGIGRWGAGGAPINKIEKSLIQNDGPNPHRNFSILPQLESV